MPFESGHKKRGGRKAGTPNRLTGEAREVARRLLGDAEYERSLRKRLIRGEAPRMEVFLWEFAYGKPRAEPEEPSKRDAPSAALVQILEKLGDPKPARPPAPLPLRDVDPRETEAN